jgi:hypothetical protein
VSRLVEEASDLYRTLAEPRGIREEVSAADFEGIYRGEGQNGHRTPLETVFPRAARLSLFAVTLGEALGRMIGDLFDENEPALGAILDAIASERADFAAERAAARFRDEIVRGRLLPDSTRVLAYSPGYCGWHITGQRRLFLALRPGRIGIRLNESCLMQPLKSVSGVLVAGPGAIHEFVDDFEFCGLCSTRQCRERIDSVRD